MGRRTRGTKHDDAERAFIAVFRSPSAIEAFQFFVDTRARAARLSQVVLKCSGEASEKGPFTQKEGNGSYMQSFDAGFSLG